VRSKAPVVEKEINYHGSLRETQFVKVKQLKLQTKRNN
jgi:hypothetical protein